ncbi:MAG: hypothetical protein E3J86_14230 [Candidatus Thorarchaeota archaeon]|nr:MAG: hypothetical protein E3J86_14230 [Candidatus Thorarchaeota archaeon]
MKKRSAFILMFGLLIITFNVAPQSVGLPTEYQSGDYVTWTVNVAPRNTTIMYYSEGGNMLAENRSIMSCIVDSVANDIVGTYYIGNISVTANDTEIARDLVLGVWGTPTEWWPGMFVKTGQSNIESLNETAYAAAERGPDNFLNGTMSSRYDNVSVVVWNSISETYNTIDEECIVFNFQQDPTGFGEPQVTHLAYSLNSGVLVKANTSYSFGDPYNLVLSLVELAPPIPVDFTVNPGVFITITGVLGGALLAVIVVVYIKLSRSN